MPKDIKKEEGLPVSNEKKKCRDCKWLIGQKNKQGVECLNPGKVWRKADARFKAPSGIACKSFGEKPLLPEDENLLLKKEITDLETRLSVIARKADKSLADLDVEEVHVARKGCWVDLPQSSEIACGKCGERVSFSNFMAFRFCPFCGSCNDL